VTFTAAAIGASGSIEADAFYDQLVQPAWAPPPGLFGPVWTLLYVLMAIAAWLVWRAEGLRTARMALGLFLVQLALNSLWSWLFFVWNLGGMAFVEVVLLWILIVVTLVAFWRVRPLAGVLLAPYLMWVSFAAALNYALWQLNLQFLGSWI
jgi:benzodiazapine receptor